MTPSELSTEMLFQGRYKCQDIMPQNRSVARLHFGILSLCLASSVECEAV